MGSTLYRMICTPGAAIGISGALKQRELAVAGWRVHVHNWGCLSRIEQPWLFMAQGVDGIYGRRSPAGNQASDRRGQEQQHWNQ
jgi:hypothetical protein